MESGRHCRHAGRAPRRQRGRARRRRPNRALLRFLNEDEGWVRQRRDMLDQQRERERERWTRLRWAQPWFPGTVAQERGLASSPWSGRAGSGRAWRVRGKEWGALRAVWWNEMEWGGFYSRGGLGWMPWAVAVANPWSRADVREVTADEVGQTSAQWGFCRLLGLAGWASTVLGLEWGTGVTTMAWWPCRTRAGARVRVRAHKRGQGGERMWYSWI
jgi:hypothetical protein